MAVCVEFGALLNTSGRVVQCCSACVRVRTCVCVCVYVCLHKGVSVCVLLFDI